MIIEMIKSIGSGATMVMGIVSAEMMRIGDRVTVFSESHEPIPCRITGIEVYAPNQGHAFDMMEVKEVGKGKPAGVILAGTDVEAVASGDRVEIES